MKNLMLFKKIILLADGKRYFLDSRLGEKR